MENAQPEPSMEEILASIRRIISEDEDDQTAPAPTAAKAAPEPAQESTLAQESAPAAPPEPAEPAKPELTLTPEAARPPAAHLPAEQAGDVGGESRFKTEDVEMVKQKAAAPMQQDTEEDILDRSAAAAASQAFQNLSQSVRISEGPGRTLEDIVTEMLKPMVKDWLDANLPGIVEEKVEEEVQRVARRRRG